MKKCARVINKFNLYVQFTHTSFAHPQEFILNSPSLAYDSHNDEPHLLESHQQAQPAATNRALLRLVYVKELGTIGVDVGSLATNFAKIDVFSAEIHIESVSKVLVNVFRGSVG